MLFRGSGFYQTDYRSAEYRRKAEAEGKDSSSDASKTSSSKTTATTGDSQD